MKHLLTFLFVVALIQSQAQEVPKYSGKFDAIDRLLEPPSPYRTASGAPGAEYWQQKADSSIRTWTFNLESAAEPPAGISRPTKLRANTVCGVYTYDFHRFSESAYLR